MEGLLNIDPGLMLWTIINFSIFFVLLWLFGVKPLIKGLKSREDKINNSIEAAENSRVKAEELLLQSQEKINSAQKEVGEIITRGRDQAQQIIDKATAEADAIRNKKIEDAGREIDRKKLEAIKELRTEVANLVIIATEKVLNEKIDKERHLKLIEQSIEKLPSN